MFTALKRLFGKRVEETADSADEHSSAAPHSGAAAGYSSNRVDAAKPVRTDAQPRGVAPLANTPATLAIPLRSILCRLGPDLTLRVRQIEVGETEFFIPMQKVLTQIAQGAVKLSFGELRQGSPPGTFNMENDRDRTLVELPLQEILSRLNPALLTRRPSQKHVEIPAEITGPFGGQTKIVISTTTLKTPEAAPVPLAAPAPAPRAPIPATLPPAAPRVQQPPLPPSPSVPMTPAVPRTQPAAAPALIFSRTPTPAAPGQPAAAPVQPLPRVQPAQPIAARIAPGTNGQKAAPAQPAAAPDSSPIGKDPFVRKTEPAGPVSQPAPTSFPLPASRPGGIPMSDTFRKLSPGVPITTISPEASEAPEPIRFTTLPTAAPAPAPAQAPVAPAPVETRFVIAGFPELSAAWPDDLRNDLKQHNFTKSVVLLPMGVVEAAIKQGKVSFTWQTMRAWIKPQLPPDAASAHDAMVLDLPLKVIIPLFLAEIKGLKPQKKFVLEDDEEPDVFSATRPPEAAPAAPAPAPVAARPAPAPAPAPAAPAVTSAPAAPVFTVRPPPPTPAPSSAPAVEAQKSPDTNYFVWNQTDESAVEDTALFVKKGDSPGTAFLNRYATPNQIVDKAASLEGVDGTLIALPDGLLVASRIPPTMNADTIAAFLPQIFARVSQCTRELRLGDLNNLNFTVGNIPWKIFKVGSIYFAAFGRPGEPLPSAKLAVIAAELDRKAK